MALAFLSFFILLSQTTFRNMSPSTLAISIVLLVTFIYILRTALSRPKQPPGPPSLPIIGNLHLLGKLPHRSLQYLAKKYGPIMFLKLGNVPTIVVSSPEAAELFLKTYDMVFASRPKFQAIQYTYGTESVAFAEYGAYWRSVRKLCTIHLLSASKVESFAPLRREELGLMVNSIKKAVMAREIVDLSQKLGEFVEDIACKMILGRNKDDRFDLKALLQETMSISGAFNLADYVPWLGPFDLQGLRRRSKKNSKELDKMLEQIIEEHQLATSSSHGDHKNFIGTLVSLMTQPIHPDHDDEQTHIIDKANIKGILLDMIIGTIETTSVVIEWAISELLRHPRAMKKLQNELKDVVGMNKMVEERDLEETSYLDLVIKETLRLYPAVPLLAPHESIQDAVVEGYHIKKKSRIIVNAWAIGRDPRVWSNGAEEFYPERFINSNIDLKGQDFQLIPFGSGRRGCPGLLLGLTTTRLVLAQLVHCFNWELLDELDMNEKSGLSIPRAKHLLAIPTYRLLQEGQSNQLR